MAGSARRPAGTGRVSPATSAAVIDVLPLVWRGLAALLDELGVAVVAAGRHSAHVLQTARQEDADLIVVGRPAFGPASEAVRAATGLPAAPGVVALAATRAASETRALLEAGASAVVARSAADEAIKQALAEVAAGRRLLPGDLVGPLLAQRDDGGGAPHDRATTADADERPMVSAREQAVLEGLAAGLTNQQIAARLYLSPATVKTHVAHLARKLGTSDRRATVAAAIASGLLG